MTATATAATPTLSRGAQLGAFLQQYPVRSWNWATANCCTFAAAWVQAMEGHNPMPPLPATATARSVQQLVQQYGGLAAMVSTLLRRDSIAPTAAQVGDLVLSPCGMAPTHVVAGAGYALGICAGRTAVHIDLHGAAVHLPMAQALVAWRVAQGAH